MGEVLCFDVYGSTHDQESVAHVLVEATGVPVGVGRAMARLWAREQLEYSMEVTLMDEYETWWTLAEHALEYVLEYYDIDLLPATRTEVLEAYNHLEPYEDWTPFERLQDAGHDLYILSDGNPEMLETLARNTGMDAYLDGIISAHEARAFKPHPDVYRTVTNHVDRPIEECWLVATHLFDLAGAHNTGMHTAFINRHNTPARRLDFTPDLTVPTYAELADELA